MKKLTVFAVASLALILAGCGDDNEEPKSPETIVNELFEVHNVPVNGKMVTCIVYDDGNHGSELSCNWSAAK